MLSSKRRWKPVWRSASGTSPRCVVTRWSSARCTSHPAPSVRAVASGWSGRRSRSAVAAGRGGGGALPNVAPHDHHTPGRPPSSAVRPAPHPDSLDVGWWQVGTWLRCDGSTCRKCTFAACSPRSGSRSADSERIPSGAGGLHRGRRAPRVAGQSGYATCGQSAASRSPGWLFGRRWLLVRWWFSAALVASLARTSRVSASRTRFALRQDQRALGLSDQPRPIRCWRRWPSVTTAPGGRGLVRTIFWGTWCCVVLPRTVSGAGHTVTQVVTPTLQPLEMMWTGDTLSSRWPIRHSMTWPCLRRRTRKISRIW